MFFGAKGYSWLFAWRLRPIHIFTSDHFWSPSFLTYGPIQNLQLFTSRDACFFTMIKTMKTFVEWSSGFGWIQSHYSECACFLIGRYVKKFFFHNNQTWNKSILKLRKYLSHSLLKMDYDFQEGLFFPLQV